jgi:hypothetical protein
LVGGVAIKVSLVIAQDMTFHGTENFDVQNCPTLQKAMEHFSKQGGAWAEMMTANHMR